MASTASCSANGSISRLGRELFADLRHHVYTTSRFRRRDDCKFDHQTWGGGAAPLPPLRLTVGWLLAAVPMAARPDSALRLEGQNFVRAMYCPACAAIVTARRAWPGDCASPAVLEVRSADGDPRFRHVRMVGDAGACGGR